MSLPLTDETKRWVLGLWNAPNSPFETQGSVAYEAVFSYTAPDGTQACVLEVRTPAGKTEQRRIPVPDLETLALETGHDTTPPAPPKRKRK